MFLGHILDDQDLVDTLQKSKGMAEAMYKRISQSEDTEKKLSLARQRYLPVSFKKPNYFVCFFIYIFFYINGVLYLLWK